MPLLIAIGAAGVAFFIVLAIGDFRIERNKTEVERRRDRIEFERVRRERSTLKQRLANVAEIYGWEGGFALPLAALGFVYLAAAVALSTLGLGGIVGIGLALPVSLGIVLGAARSARSRRKRVFNRQLIQALDLFAAQLRGGAGPKRAVSAVVDSLPEPLRSEMLWVVAQTDTNRKLGDALADLQIRYPSKALKLFVAAIRIDEHQGTQIAGALEQAATTVRKELELSSEAQAELAQTRYEFFGILGIMSFVLWLMIGNADPATKQVYASFSGILWLSIAGLNFGFGVWRVTRILNRARGDV